MQSTTTPTLYPAPPSTVNALSPATRAALLRQTRKLGAVLGQPPRLLDLHACKAPQGTQPLRLARPAHARTHSSPPASPIRAAVGEAERRARRRQRRQGSVFELPPLFTDVPRPTLRAVPSRTDLPALDPASASSSTDSDRDSPVTPPRPRSRSFARPRGARARKAPPPPLVLALNVQQENIPAPAPAPAPAASYFSPDTAAVPSYFSPDTSLPDVGLGLNILPTTPFSPASPAFTNTHPSPMPAAAARRKMAKLTRTLGEPVPVELVFSALRPAVPAVARPARSPRAQAPRPWTRNKSASRSPSRPPAPAAAPMISVTVSVSHDVALAHPPVLAPSRRFGSPAPGRRSEETPRSPPPFADAGRRRSRSFALAASSSLWGSPSTSPPLQPPHASFLDLSEVAARRPPPRRVDSAEAAAQLCVRESRGWVGEWNREDMDTVRRDLRALPRAG
jgi:hypothetical protein